MSTTSNSLRSKPSETELDFSGPLITPAAKERVERLIASCATDGGNIALDGRGVEVPGYPDGNFVGATILEADPTMECYQEEIFGPVLVIVKADDLDHAIRIINSNRCEFFFRDERWAL